MSTIDRKEIFSFFKQNPEKPWHLQDIQKQLKISDRTQLRNELSSLVNEGQLVLTRRRTYGLPQEMNLVLGRLQVTAGGYGFVIPDEGDKDLFIPAESLNGAWDGDRVMARPNPVNKRDGRQSGEIVRILERRHDVVVGTLEYSRGYAILRPDSPRLRERILLLPDSVGKLEAGSRIVVKIVWPEESGEKEPFGRVEEFLGTDDDPEVETRAVVVKYDLKDTFEPETIAEAQAVPPTVTGDMLTGRTDLRSINTFTVDGEDAKDFDDAVSLERIGTGSRSTLRIGVHIADVSYYVAEGTHLDREARERATSVYLPGQVLPMLPEELSNGICSLVEGEARLALSVLVDITRDGKVKGMKLKETVIESDARLTYEQVQEFADGGRLPQGKRKIERDLKQILKITEILRQERLAQGALNFEFTEAKVDVDDKGMLHVTPIRSNEARQMVEELMLLANRLVAKEMSDRDIPALYRVHEDPSDDKVQALQKSLGKLGYELDLAHAGPQHLQAIIQDAAGKPEAQLVNTLLLRSLKQARYSAENLGHFGLAFDNYLHFTSPIRRYPDLVVHRVVRAMLQHRLSPTLKERLKSDFPALGEHTSQRERQAEEAERDLTRYYHAMWAKDQKGEVFNGVIAGVTNFGIFVALPNGVEGLVHVSQLDDDYYMYFEDSMMLMGKHSKRKFRLGNRMEVKILNANPTVRQIDLLPGSAEMPEATEADADAPKTEKRPAPENLKTPLSTSADKRKEAKSAEQDTGALTPETPQKKPRPEPRRDKRERDRLRKASPPVAEKAPDKAPEPRTEQRSAEQRTEQRPAEPRTEPRTEQRSAEPATPPTTQAPRAASSEKKRRILVFGEHRTK
ncbi:MAG: ribonuclease R [Trueperaceae bacterium]|nr:ribonuclease R [Trueperaceae bacterium]